jgi:hypothetical protein
MRIYRTLAVIGLGLGVSAWLLDVASAQQRVQQQKRRNNPPPVQSPPVQQPVQQPVRPVRPVVTNPAPTVPRFNNKPVTNPVNNSGTPVIGGLTIQVPSTGTTTPIQGMSGSYLGNLANTGYLGGFGNGNSFFNPYSGFGNPAFGFGNTGFGNPWFGSPWGQFNTLGNPWMNSNSFGTSWGNPWGNTWGSPWGNNPYNQFAFSNPWAHNQAVNQAALYSIANSYGGMNPWNANPFQMAFPQNGPFAPMMNPFQQANAFLGGGLNNGGQVVGQPR